MSIIRNRLKSMIADAVQPLLSDGAEVNIELDMPKLPEHGDYSTNVAFGLTKTLKRSPRDVAALIIANLKDPDHILANVVTAGPGFINFFIGPRAFRETLRTIFDDPKRYGRQEIGHGKKIQVEFVSANPTGPLHIGHGRGAAIGDVLANILGACGYDVQREYYINDAGNQMETLGRSLYYRYQQELGEDVGFPDNHYRGEYMIDLAKVLISEIGPRYRDAPLGEVLAFFTSYASSSILNGIKEDLDIFGVHFQNWFSEQRELHDRDAVSTALEYLKTRGFIYEHEGAVWFRSTEFGDEKDRVVIRANGASTYFAADLAYHWEKFQRGFEMVVDIWGADHHGYVDRMRAGVRAMGREGDDLRVILVQLVNLLRAGQPVAMTTRGGEFVTLREVMDEVGKDATRFLFLTRRTDSPLDFDLEVAKAQSNDNPVFYVQYAHARLCSVFEVAAERGIAFDPKSVGPDTLEPLQLPREYDLLKLLGEYPEIIASCARTLEPHNIPYYLHSLVSLFHGYYHDNRIIGDDPALTLARLALAAGVRDVIANALELLGVSAPEKM